MDSREEFQQTFLLGVITSVVAGFLVEALVGQKRYQPGQLINPEVVAGVVKPNGSSFVQECYQWVVENIVYQSFGSEIRFKENGIYTTKCDLPEQVLTKGASNCLGMSLLLASLLRQKLSEDMVYVALGDAKLNGSWGGHAWVLVWDGDWYILDSTYEKPIWIKASANERYEAEGYFNDRKLACLPGVTICQIKG